jgi:hypothetical protein
MPFNNAPIPPPDEVSGQSSLPCMLFLVPKPKLLYVLTET